MAVVGGLAWPTSSGKSTRPGWHAVGVGKTFLATALGHAAIHRRYSVHFERGDQLLKRLKASRLDNSHDPELRKLLRVDLLILDDLCPHPLDALDTADI